MDLIARGDPLVCPPLLIPEAAAQFAAAHLLADCPTAVTTMAVASAVDPDRYADRLDPTSRRVQSLSDGRVLVDGCAIRWRDHALDTHLTGRTDPPGRPPDPPPGRITTAPVAAGSDPAADWVIVDHHPADMAQPALPALPGFPTRRLLCNAWAVKSGHGRASPDESPDPALHESGR